MKKAFFSMFLITVVCGLSFAQARQIYIAGRDGNDAVYWLNGSRTVLPKSSSNVNAYAVAITVSGSNVYIAGVDGNDAVYWLNGSRTVLPKSSDRAATNDIAVSGSNVYIAGIDGGEAVYWLNGRRTVLPKSSNNVSAYAIAIAVSGSDVYIAGRDGNDAVYWLNGRRTVLSRGSYMAAYASAITISGSDVYITGRNGNYDAVYWLNGQQTILPQPDWDDLSWARGWGSANAIVVSGSNIHIAGQDSLSGEFRTDKPMYWLNGNGVALPKSSGDVIGNASVNAIAVSGSDVFIAGFIFDVTGREGSILNGQYNAVYWLNGRRNDLPSSSDANANGIAIIE